MKIDQAVVDDYWSKGWTVVENVFGREETDRIAELALTIGNQEAESDSAAYTVDRAANGQFAPRKMDHAFKKHPEFRNFVLNQRLVDLVGQFLGTRPLLARDQIFLKPPKFGSAKPYHQDNAYFRIYPADHVITAWIALDDVDEENGCLRYIDGSHRGPLLSHEVVGGEKHVLSPPPEQIDLSKESMGIVNKGGVVFHHSQTLHTSHRNESDRWRRGYATHWVTAEVTCEKDTLDEAYYLGDDYPKAHV